MGLENTSVSEAGTHGTAAVCLLKCWERTSENHILHAGNEPLLDIWAAAEKATLQRQVASRGPPSSMEYLNRLFPSNSPPQNNPSRACTHSHTHPSQNKEGSQTSPVCTGQSGQGHKRQVCAMGVWRQTDTRPCTAAALPAGTRGGREGTDRTPGPAARGGGGHQGGHLGAPRPRGLLRCFRSARATRVACLRRGPRRRGAAAALGSGREGAGRALGSR